MHRNVAEIGVDGRPSDGRRWVLSTPLPDEIVAAAAAAAR